MNTIW